MMTTTLDRLRALAPRAPWPTPTWRSSRTPARPALGFDERFSMLVDAEQLFRDNRALTRRLKEAKLRIPHACLEDLDYAPRRGLDRARHPATRDVPLDCRAPQRPDHRRHRRRQDVSGLCARAAGLSPGLPRDLSPAAAAL